MQRRLNLAHKLLKPTGVIIVAIGDDEHHRLRMLMDQVFGAGNFVSDVVWQGGRKNDSRYVSNGADYMLIYARNEGLLRDLDLRWRERKPGIDEVLEAAAHIWEDSGGDHAEATKRYRAWMKAFKAKGIASDAVTRFVTLDEQGRPIRTDGSIASPNPRPNLTYDLIHPVTGGQITPPLNGWRYSRAEMDRRISEGLIVFGSDEQRQPSGKTYLESMDSHVPESVFVRDRNPSGKHLAAVLGDKRFPFPKDHEVLKRWIGLTAPRDGVILDFFAGSGSTAEAVIRLNAEDGGTRQAILVTNNELSKDDARKLRKQGYQPGDPEWEARGVFRHVTKPRIETIVTGLRAAEAADPGSPFSEGLAASVDFFDLTYLESDRIKLDLAFEAVAPLLWMKAGARGEPITERNDATGWSTTAHYGVLHDVDRWREFALAVPPSATHAFIVTDSPSAFATASAAQPAGVEALRLYENYLKTFEINTIAAVAADRSTA